MKSWFAGLVLASSLASTWADEPVRRIGFGSCYKPEKSTPLWGKVSEFDPQVWLWLGDNVYADVIDGKYVKTDLPKDAFARAYADLEKSEGVAALQRLPKDRVMATWDDHDYGRNDSGKEWQRKRDAQKAFLDFWGGEERNDGIYSSRDFGPEGKRVRVILLDTRFNRDEPGPVADMLGSRQWKWLEEELRKTGADLIVLGSSVQVLPTQHRFEKWGNFPKAKKRLFRLIQESGARVVLISGDRHHAEISKLSESPAGYPLYEVTSSGLTEKSTIRDEVNDLRVGEVFTERNFGVLEIDWSLADPAIRLQIRNEEGIPVLDVPLSLSQLAPPKG